MDFASALVAFSLVVLSMEETEEEEIEEEDAEEVNEWLDRQRKEWLDGYEWLVEING